MYSRRSPGPGGDRGGGGLSTPACPSPVLRYASDGNGADKNSRRSPGPERAKPLGVPSSGDPNMDEMYQTVLVVLFFYYSILKKYFQTKVIKREVHSDKKKFLHT